MHNLYLSAGHRPATLPVPAMHLDPPVCNHKNGPASLADEHARMPDDFKSLVPGPKPGVEGVLTQEAWARDVIDQVECIRAQEPELNFYHLCRKAGVTVQLYKEARAYYGGSQ